MSDVVRDLERVIRQRQADMPEGSYTTSLFRDGTQRIAQKVGEEGVEVVIAGMAQDDGRLTSEMAEFYHSLVLLVDRGLSWADVEAVFVRRAQRVGAEPLPFRDVCGVSDSACSGHWAKSVASRSTVVNHEPPQDRERRGLDRQIHWMLR